MLHSKSDHRLDQNVLYLDLHVGASVLYLLSYGSEIYPNIFFPHEISQTYWNDYYVYRISFLYLSFLWWGLALENVTVLLKLQAALQKMFTFLDSDLVFSLYRTYA